MLPESKYVHAVKIQEGEYFLASNGDPGPDSIFAVERYINTQSNGPSYYYRMRRKGTKEYLYIEDDRLLLGVSKQTYDTNKNTPNKYTVTNRTSCTRGDSKQNASTHTHTLTNTCTNRD